MVALTPDGPLWSRLPCGFVLLDAQGAVTACNQTGTALLRLLLPAASAGGLPHPGHHPRLGDAIRRTASDATMRELTLRTPPSAEGFRTTLLVTCLPDVGGGVLITLTKADPRPIVEMTDPSVENQFRILATLANDWFWSSDAEDRFTQIYDDEGRRTVAPEASGKRRQDFLDDREDPADFPRIATAIAARQPFNNLVYPQRRLDGGTRWVSVSGTPQYDQDDRFVGYAGTARDITRQRRAEDELRQAAAELETRVRARTRDLEAARDRHRGAEEAAAQANRAKSLFLTAASHDLRQPLQSAITYFGVLGRAVKEAADREVYAKLGQSLGVIADRIEQLVDIARMDSGTVDIRREPFPISHLFRALREHFAPTAAAGGVALDIADNPLCVVSDPHHCERILHNLLDNAVKFASGAEVRVRATGDGQKVTITVEDTGPGIAAHHMPRLTEDYYRAAVDGAPEGRGLGLAIANRLARLLGHRLELTSRPHRGTRVTLTLPAAAADEQSEPQRPEASIDPPRRVTGRHGPIMVIEDETQVLDSLCEALRDAGYSVMAATSLDDALGQLVRADGSPKLVLTDQKLAGGRTGQEAIAVLRRVFGPTLPAMILTGDSAMLTDAAGSAVPVLAKPIGAEDLRKAVEGALASDALERTPPPQAAGWASPI